MATTITIDPVTRIEGHLEIEVTVDDVGGEQQVVAAKSAGTMFRGFEIILVGRDPRDAGQYTQRICGVCPVSHAMASSQNLDNAFGLTPPDNGRILRNLVLGANFISRTCCTSTTCPRSTSSTRPGCSTCRRGRRATSRRTW